MDQNWYFYDVFFSWNYFPCGRIPSFSENISQNVNRLWEEFRRHLILWVTIWAEFFSHCDSHREKIVRKLWVEMNTLIAHNSLDLTDNKGKYLDITLWKNWLICNLDEVDPLWLVMYFLVTYISSFWAIGYHKFYKIINTQC